MMTIGFNEENTDDVRRKYFGCGDEEDEIEKENWCELSETRLFIKFAQFKPAGVSKHLNMVHLINSLNNIYPDEKDTNFRDYLSDEHYKELKMSNSTVTTPSQNSTTTTSNIISKTYPPAYRIRPTSKQIEEKLNEYYSMEQINENEVIPDCFLKQIDFYLPQWLQPQNEQRPILNTPNSSKKSKT